MVIFIIQNVAWSNYYMSLVNIILDNKALYEYKHKHEINTAFSRIILLLQTEKNVLHMNMNLYESTKQVEGSDL